MLKISTPCQSQLHSFITQGYPHETCGVLLGKQNNNTREILQITQAKNLNEEKPEVRYDLDPKDLLKADNLAKENGWEIIGIWHSHPDHPAKPSETDRQGAWSNWSYVIVSVTQQGIEDTRSWLLNGEEFIEEEII